jgi:glycosyltransferase involved in cell wall biosynthesis
MRICLVTAFPPSTQRINEYGLHLARQAREQGAQLVVLADEYEPHQPELDGFDVRRCWAFNSLENPWRILAAARSAKADVVWFNLVYSTFGDQPLAAFLGLCTPLLLRLCGFRTQVTLHHLMENVDLRHADIRFPRLYMAAGSLATRLLLKSHQVSVLLELYRKRLMEQYGARNVNVRRHGILGTMPEPPDFALRKEGFRVLAFGKFGRYKRLEVMLDAWPAVRRQIANARLVIAGQDHPNRPGYMAGLAELHKDDPSIEFLGYVNEDGIGSVFRPCNVAVLPYSSSGGPSGVAHQAAQFGLPLIGSSIGDIVNVCTEEGLAIDYYRTGDSADLAEKIVALARDPERQCRMAEQNYEAALAMTMPAIVAGYLRDFEEPGGHASAIEDSSYQKTPWKGTAVEACVSLPEDKKAAA